LLINRATPHSIEKKKNNNNNNNNYNKKMSSIPKIPKGKILKRIEDSRVPRMKNVMSRVGDLGLDSTEIQKWLDTIITTKTKSQKLKELKTLWKKWKNIYISINTSKDLESLINTETNFGIIILIIFLFNVDTLRKYNKLRLLKGINTEILNYSINNYLNSKNEETKWFLTICKQFNKEKYELMCQYLKEKQINYKLLEKIQDPPEINYNDFTMDYNINSKSKSDSDSEYDLMIKTIDDKKHFDSLINEMEALENQYEDIFSQI
jgi:hypothetical protein